MKGNLEQPAVADLLATQCYEAINQMMLLFNKQKGHWFKEINLVKVIQPLQ